MAPMIKRENDNREKDTPYGFSQLTHGLGWQCRSLLQAGQRWCQPGGKRTPHPWCNKGLDPPQLPEVSLVSYQPTELSCQKRPIDGKSNDGVEADDNSASDATSENVWFALLKSFTSNCIQNKAGPYLTECSSVTAAFLAMDFMEKIPGHLKFLSFQFCSYLYQFWSGAWQSQA